jgi:hypothetical protein
MAAGPDRQPASIPAAQVDLNRLNTHFGLFAAALQQQQQEQQFVDCRAVCAWPQLLQQQTSASNELLQTAWFSCMLCPSMPASATVIIHHEWRILVHHQLVPTVYAGGTIRPQARHDTVAVWSHMHMLAVSFQVRYNKCSALFKPQNISCNKTAVQLSARVLDPPSGTTLHPTPARSCTSWSQYCPPPPICDMKTIKQELVQHANNASTVLLHCPTTKSGSQVLQGASCSTSRQSSTNSLCQHFPCE